MVVTDTYPRLAFFGHHKCATGWIDGILMEVAFHMGITFWIVHRPWDWRQYRSLPDLARTRRVDLLAYTNAEAAQAAELGVERAFHVVRDPRDVLVSAYFSHLKTHPTTDWPELEEHRRRLQQVSKEEGLFLEMEFSRQEFLDMEGWDYGQPHVLEVRFEELTARPLEGFIQILAHLGLLRDEAYEPVRELGVRAALAMNRLNRKGRRFMPLNLPLFPVPRRRLDRIPLYKAREIVEGRSFTRLAGGRRPGQENHTSHYRKGEPGDWRNHFTEAHKERFKELFNPVLVTLGYERDASW